jgi:hypothetical protein
MRSRLPVVIVNVIDYKDSRLRALGLRISKGYGQKRKGAERELPSGNNHVNGP